MSITPSSGTTATQAKVVNSLIESRATEFLGFEDSFFISFSLYSKPAPSFVGAKANVLLTLSIDWTSSVPRGKTETARDCAGSIPAPSSSAPSSSGPPPWGAVENPETAIGNEIGHVKVTEIHRSELLDLGFRLLCFQEATQRPRSPSPSIGIQVCGRRSRL